MSFREMTKEYTEQFDVLTRQLAVKAIKDLRAEGRSYRWIYTAFVQKNKKDWEKFGFGLCWNNRFVKQVDARIAREDAAVQEESFDDFWNSELDLTSTPLTSTPPAPQEALPTSPTFTNGDGRSLKAHSPSPTCSQELTLEEKIAQLRAEMAAR